ncbi:MAG: DUF5658 family protein [Phycisphaerae bacterium]|nr:DUF5658 family protein [Phycisphaerae bacterium]
MQTEQKQIGLIFLFLILPINSASANLREQTEAVNSAKGRCLLLQVGLGRTARGASNPEQVEISTGFVILHGQYIIPPYTIAVKDNEVFLNGIALPPLSDIQSNQHPHVQRRGTRRAPLRQVGWLKQNLEQDALLIHLNTETIALIPYYQASTVLDTLLSSESPEEKVQLLAQEEMAGFSSIDWASLVNGFETSPELQDRVANLRETLAQQQKVGDKAVWYLTGPFPIMPILGFAMTVLALGTLLNCRPPNAFSRLSQRHRKICSRQVFYLVGLMVVLNLYDLACTLFARGCVGFWEMNPYAAGILEIPPMVVCFKLSLTVGPAILLIIARHCKLAQVASWWGGVLYTVLILRWVTFNAMFTH